MEQKIKVDTVYEIIEKVFDEAVKKRWQKGTIQKSLVYYISLAADPRNQDIEFEDEGS